MRRWCNTAASHFKARSSARPLAESPLRREEIEASIPDSARRAGRNAFCQESWRIFSRFETQHRPVAAAYLNLADAFVRVGQPKEARKNYERYLRFAPNAQNADEVRQRIVELQDKE